MTYEGEEELTVKAVCYMKILCVLNQIFKLLLVSR